MLRKALTLLACLAYQACDDPQSPASPTTLEPPAPTLNVPAECGELAKLVGTSEYAKKVSGDSKLISLWWSGELTAPASLTSQIQDDLLRIGKEYAQEVSAVACLGYFPPWAPSSILVSGYTPNKCLEEALGMETATEIGPVTNAHGLHFKGIQNSERLADIYKATGKHASANGFLGDHSGIVPWIEPNFRAYAFRLSWGDCPSGCIGSRIWYFRVSEKVEYVGEWVSGSEEPKWVQEVFARLYDPKNHSKPAPLSICGLAVP